MFLSDRLWQGDGETGSAAGPVITADASAMLFDDALRNTQAEAAPRRLAAGKWLEEMLDDRWRNAAARV